MIGCGAFNVKQLNLHWQAIAGRPRSRFWDLGSILIDPAQKRYNTVPHSFRVFAE
jgi:hypothetical protein